MPLSDRDMAIVDLERNWFLEPVSKERTIRRRLGLSATRYYQLLNDLVEGDDALSYDPLVVRRVRRQRDLRRRARFEGRSVGQPPRR